MVSSKTLVEIPLELFSCLLQCSTVRVVGFPVNPVPKPRAELGVGPNAPQV